MNCIFCKEIIKDSYSFGEQIVCTHFVSPDEVAKDKFHQELSIGFCNACGLIQQTNTFPVEQLIPPFDWLECTEPEAHLDNLVRTFIDKYNFTNKSKIIGVSWKDDTTLDRIEKLVACKTYRLSQNEDLLITNPLADIESVQEKLTKDSIQQLSKHKEEYDFLFARHILEHAHDLKEFIEASMLLVKEGGHLMFEIPDCLRALKSLDYTVVWEEHTSYFTPATLQHLFQTMGLLLSHYECAEYTLENSLIVVLKKSKGHPYSINIDQYIKSQRDIYTSFTIGFNQTKRNLHSFLNQEKAKGKKVALFGAAHMSIVFINLMNAHELIDYVIDDNNDKLKYCMPGSGLKIVPSTTLQNGNVDICILSLSPTSEEKVLPKHSTFVNKGGTWYSIFPGNSRALPIYQGEYSE